MITELEKELKSLQGNEFDELKIWSDRHIDRTADLTDELRRKVKASGILMIIMSPRYLKSAWCSDELNWFREQVEDRSREIGRVFVIRAVSTNEADWPDFLRDERRNVVIGFYFHPRLEGEEDIAIEPFGWPDLIKENREFINTVIY